MKPKERLGTRAALVGGMTTSLRLRPATTALPNAGVTNAVAVGGEVATPAPASKESEFVRGGGGTNALPRSAQVETPSQTGVMAGLAASLGRPVAAVMLGMTLLATPVQGAPLSHEPETSVTTSYAGDTHTKKGQSDAQGDLKNPQLVLRHKGWVLGAEAAMITPQRGATKQQYDTGLGSLTVGRESESASVYATVGQLNGVASDAMYGIIDASHKKNGMGPARKSPESRAPGLYGAVSGRVDHDVDLAKLGPVNLRLETAAHGTLGTIKQSVGAAALIALESDSARFRPNLPDMPAPSLQGTALYAGFTAEAVASDVVTDRLGTEHLRSAFVAGASVGLGKNTAVGVEYRQPLTPEVRDATEQPISSMRFTFTHKF
jgi:hypothetical protein